MERLRLKEVNPKNMDIEQMRVVLAAFESFLMQYLDKNYSKIANDYFLAVCAEEAKRLIACFSEDKVSNLMWSHYADSHKGFCIEYNLSDLIQGCECNCDNPRFCMNIMMNTPVAPVIYADSRYDASVTLVNSIVQYLSEMSGVKMKPLYEDYLFILKCLLTKSIEWNYEREWRLFSVNREIKEHGVICKHAPTAVYIGSKMPNDDAEVLYGICQDKKIECYKMIMNYMGMDYGIQPMKYEEYRKIALKG